MANSSGYKGHMIEFFHKLNMYHVLFSVLNNVNSMKAKEISPMRARETSFHATTYFKEIDQLQC